MNDNDNDNDSDNNDNNDNANVGIIGIQKSLVYRKQEDPKTTGLASNNSLFKIVDGFGAHTAHHNHTK